MGMIELVDFNEIYGKTKDESKEGAKRTRRGRSTAKKADAPKPASEAPADTAATATEDAKEEKSAE
jgi:large subunit ribosomal protein L17